MEKSWRKYVLRTLILAFTLSQCISSLSTTVQMIQAIGSDVSGIAASVISADPTATTYAMSCGTSFPSSVSGFPSEVICRSIAALTITQGPSTLAFTTAAGVGDVKAALGCKLAEREAVCTRSWEGIMQAESMTQGMEGNALEEYVARLEAWKTPEVTTLAGGVTMGPVVVTAGVEKLTASVSTSGSKVSGATAKTTSKSGAMPTGAPIINGVALAAGILGIMAL